MRSRYLKDTCPRQDVKGIHSVRPDNRKVLRAPGSTIKYLKRLFVSFNKL